VTESAVRARNFCGKTSVPLSIAARFFGSRSQARSSARKPGFEARSSGGVFSSGAGTYVAFERSRWKLRKRYSA
jgi:hypothetical protein